MKYAVTMEVDSEPEAFAGGFYMFESVERLTEVCCTGQWAVYGLTYDDFAT